MAENSESKSTNAENISIGMNIKNARMKKGLSQEQLAETLDITNTHISYLETDTKYPSLDMLIKIANALDVSADDLLVGELTHTSSPVGRELHAILQDCNHDEREMLIQILKFIKKLFRKYNI